MDLKTAIHDDSLAGNQLSKLALFSLTTIDEKPELGSRRVVRGLEIFRAGTFKDSKGEQRTWTVDDLQDMADNFAKLRSSGTFPNVPVRTDHSASVASLVGYIENVTVVGDRLVADVEFTEPDHFAKFDRGTYRSRSIELGSYEDNTGSKHWPVVLGLAFVDIPAVEGLHRSPVAVATFRYDDKEGVVPDKDDPKATFTFRLRGQDETDFAKVQAHVAALEGEVDGLKARNEALETFAAEQTKSNRHNFVTSLAEAKKIAATQIDALKALVEGMNDEQFEAFTKAYEGAPAISMLGNHAEGVSNPTGEPAENDEAAVLAETIAMHRRAGMSDDELAKTSSYRKLAALNGAK